MDPELSPFLGFAVGLTWAFFHSRERARHGKPFAMALACLIGGFVGGTVAVLAEGANPIARYADWLLGAVLTCLLAIAAAVVGVRLGRHERGQP
jgi:hypothetical protein